MNEREKQKKAKAFSEYWQGRGYEKGESQPFWLSLLRDIFGVEHPEQFIRFEEQVKIDRKNGFIDGVISSTKVLIEQKSREKDLRKPIQQADGSLLNPFQQAKKYIVELPVSEHPRWVITCNFQEFLIYDMEKPSGEPESILLKDLPKEYYRLQFLVEEKNELLHREEQISIQAGELVGKLYDAILNQYVDSTDPKTLHSLNILCVRIVFCLYAEDAGIFGEHLKFHNYIKKIADKDIDDVREALIKLFRVLDQPLDKRDPYLKADLASFPYVNGGLFADEDIEIPNFTQDIVDLLLRKASEDFDWSQISPTIFGAVFESTLNPETRRSGGMHYTSIENIHKVIDPLFLDELREEFDEIKALKVPKIRNDKAEAFREKLSTLTFFDPACGSGNFLTETYISLRRLENEAIRIAIDSMQVAGQIAFGFGNIGNPIKVSIGQFYGIEINDFAVTVAKTALWIAESQMMHETEEILQVNLDFLPLKSYANIVEGNALRTEWETVVPKDKLNYIMGNPPFVGQSNRTKDQSNDMNLIFGQGNIITKQDYVLCWYEKAISFLNTNNLSNVCVAFVSTNSICQGESVPTFWKHMVEEHGAEIQFAYPSFIWDSEANEKAHVHCVIVGFTNHKTNKTKYLINDGGIRKVEHINGYLYDAPDIWLENRTNKTDKNFPKMTTGSPPTDDGGLLLTAEEKAGLLSKYPILDKYIKPFIGAREFLHDKMGSYSRYCLWFKDGNPGDYNKIKEIIERLERVKALRLSSNADRIQKMAIYPYLFCQDRQPNTTYLVIPRHSSQNRKYIPIGFMTPDVIAGDACTIVPNMNVYQFGIMTSNVHNAWMRVVCGRIKSDFRYSPATYNNFPWPTPTAEQKALIEKTAQDILAARTLYSESCLADLYDELTMPPELRKAHQANDKAVMQAYGFWGRLNTESACVAELMKMYQKLTQL